MQSLSDYDPTDFAAELARRGHKPSHAGPILRAFYASGGKLDVSTLRGSRAMLDELQSEFAEIRSSVLYRHASADGTVKLLVGFSGGGNAEAVLMPTGRDGVAAGCVSSQIGCAMGCDFCASTKDGLERNLTASEIVDQFLHLRREASSSGRKLRTIVFMGMGEPLHNLDNVVSAVRRLAHPDLGGIGWRQVTVSTVGIVPGIDRLTELDLNIHLALSLHAPDDTTRDRLVPANRRYPVADILAAARRYYAKTGREVNIEYCVLGGVNDSAAQAHKLAGLLEGFRAHVNLIPYNPIGVGLSGVAYSRPGANRVSAMLSILRERNVVAHVRTTRGDAINAACGQLRQTKTPALAG